MDEIPGKKVVKWKLNLFDVIFIACALTAAVFLLRYTGRTSGGVGVLPSGSQETIVYTIELQGMINQAAELIKPGDSLIDKVEKRALGTILSVELVPSKTIQKNFYTGDYIVSVIPERTDAIVVATAQGVVTESQISVDGFAIRVGTRVSINGPLYNSSGFITDIARS